MSEDEIVALAGEYVIGTLDGDERADVDRRLAGDAALRRSLAEWERRLAPLGQIGAGIEPPSDLWTRIERALAAPGGARLHVHQLQVHQLQVHQGGLQDGNAADLAGTARQRGAAAAVPGVLLRRSRDRWRALAVATSGLAAALATFLVVRDVAVRPADPAATYVAAVNRGGNKPALIVTVDLRTRRVLVRPVDATTPAGHSLQLWYIGDKQAPRSMGLVGDTVSAIPLPTDAPADGAATFAVSLEPQGGSTTGGPTGAVLYSGQLVRE